MKGIRPEKPAIIAQRRLSTPGNLNMWKEEGNNNNDEAEPKAKKKAVSKQKTKPIQKNIETDTSKSSSSDFGNQKPAAISARRRSVRIASKSAEMPRIDHVQTKQLDRTVTINLERLTSASTSNAHSESANTPASSSDARIKAADIAPSVETIQIDDESIPDENKNENGISCSLGTIFNLMEFFTAKNCDWNLRGALTKAVLSQFYGNRVVAKGISYTARCLLCPDTFGPYKYYQGNTSNLNKHLKKVGTIWNSKNGNVEC